MLIMLGNAGQAEFSTDGGEIVYYGFRISQSDEVIALEHKEERILEITKKKRIFYKPTSNLKLKKELDTIELGDNRVLIIFSNCDVIITVYGVFVVEFQNFLKDGWEIELI